MSLPRVFCRLWWALRQLSGDDAYARYLAHWCESHADEGGEPLSPRAFYTAEQERKWNGIKRCC